MIPIIIILCGLVIFFLSLLKILKFTDSLSEKIRELNELYSSDSFVFHKKLREEVDELNYSYYEILDRQDLRISDLEEKLKDYELHLNKASDLEDNAIKSVNANESIDVNIIKKENKLTNQSDESIVREGNIEEKNIERNDELRQKVIILYNEGKNSSEIAEELGIGIGSVNLICSVYNKN